MFDQRNYFVRNIVCVLFILLSYSALFKTADLDSSSDTEAEDTGFIRERDVYWVKVRIIDENGVILNNGMVVSLPQGQRTTMSALVRKIRELLAKPRTNIVYNDRVYTENSHQQIATIAGPEIFNNEKTQLTAVIAR